MMQWNLWDLQNHNLKGKTAGCKRIVIAALLCLAAAFVFVGCSSSNEAAAPEDSSSEAQMSGAYSEDRELTEEDIAVFEEALSGLTGVVYEPLMVSTQVVAGTNYRFTCNATIVVPDAEPYTAYVYVFRSLDGEVELVEIERED